MSEILSKASSAFLDFCLHYDTDEREVYRERYEQLDEREIERNEMSRSTQKSRPEPISDMSHVLTFGKYKGATIADILDADPNYLLWLHNNCDFFELDYRLLENAEEGFTTEPTWSRQ